MNSTTQGQDHVVTLNGLRFHYVAWGSDDAPPLVLIHGLGFTGRGWQAFAERMASRFRVIAPDLRGHGETDWAQDYAWQRNIDDLEALRRTLGTEQFVLLGLSRLAAGSLSRTLPSSRSACSGS